VRHYQRDPVHHEVPTDPTDGARVTHLEQPTARNDRVAATAELIRVHGSTIVFCRTRRGADRVAIQLKGFGLRVAAMHGSRSQNQREQALAAFAAGRVDALVATDVAARGIHVDDVGVVIHWDPVDSHKDYVHRSGRTGRAGARGTVVSLVSEEARAKTVALQRALELPVGVDRPDIDVAGLHKAFAAAYWRRFGIELAEIPPVLVNLHTAVIGQRPEIDLALLVGAERAKTLKDAQSGERRVWFADGWHQTPIYARDRLPLDAVFEGPAILEQLDCTTVVEPGDKVRQDKLGNLLISVG